MWKTENCSKVETDPPLLTGAFDIINIPFTPPTYGKFPSFFVYTVNSITVDLSVANVRAVPAAADPVAKLETVPQMAKHNG